MSLADDRVVRTICQECGSKCGMNVQVEGGRAVRVAAAPDSRNASSRFCSRANAALERLYSPYRLLYPQKRAGAKGEGKWQRITPPYSPEMGSPKMRGFLCKVYKAE